MFWHLAWYVAGKVGAQVSYATFTLALRGFCQVGRLVFREAVARRESALLRGPRFSCSGTSWRSRWWWSSRRTGGRCSVVLKSRFRENRVLQDGVAAGFTLISMVDKKWSVQAVFVNNVGKSLVVHMKTLTLERRDNVFGWKEKTIDSKRKTQLPLGSRCCPMETGVLCLGGFDSAKSTLLVSVPYFERPRSNRMGAEIGAKPSADSHKECKPVAVGFAMGLEKRLFSQTTTTKQELSIAHRQNSSCDHNRDSATAYIGHDCVAAIAPDTNALELFRNRQNSWAVVNTSCPKFVNQAALVFIDDRLYYLGGRSQATRQIDGSMFSLLIPPIGLPTESRVARLQQASWNMCAELPEKVDKAAVIALSQRILIIGGASRGAPSNHVFVYNTQTDRWKQAASLKFARIQPVIIQLDKHLVVINGHDAVGKPVTAVEAIRIADLFLSAEYYTPTTTGFNGTGMRATGDENILQDSQHNSQATGGLSEPEDLNAPEWLFVGNRTDLLDAQVYTAAAPYPIRSLSIGHMLPGMADMPGGTWQIQMYSMASSDDQLTNPDYDSDDPADFYFS
ncbi:kelch repeat protein [Gregarina niphandrodes]|uniref:Kelch repeat protein n=1 Tax=Gregarina niphandrodes TaxID=110365 RepID=A0A023B948_GRENI|nr:kelch repeat protein [Gregarina niphandrodes]EZG70942.1 kelch repeat protein [Gregarina niphandrodes]|eukprot:XP_011129857.1 kelch repeat protein [Gregarina niphandrodes]